MDLATHARSLADGIVVVVGDNTQTARSLLAAPRQ
jgi:hypothetical protein